MGRASGFELRQTSGCTRLVERSSPSDRMITSGKSRSKRLDWPADAMSFAGARGDGFRRVSDGFANLFNYIAALVLRALDRRCGWRGAWAAWGAGLRRVPSPAPFKTTIILPRYSEPGQCAVAVTRNQTQAMTLWLRAVPPQLAMETGKQYPSTLICGSQSPGLIFSPPRMIRIRRRTTTLCRSNSRSPYLILETRIDLLARVDAVVQGDR